MLHKIGPAVLLIIAVICCTTGILWYTTRQKLPREPIIYVDFDVSMDVAHYPEKVTLQWGLPLLSIFNTLYRKKNIRKVRYCETMKIPARIHQIWLGSPFPDKYKAWQASWKHYHPSWSYKLWTDADIAALAELPDFFVGETYRYFQEATNYAEKSDILRILLLRYFGGLYVDTDYECLTSCEPLHHYWDFYVGLQPLDVACVQLGYGMIAATPHHPLVEKVIEHLSTTRHISQIVARTGPLMLTQCLACHILDYPGPAIALPASYLYPRNYYASSERNRWIKPESFAVHHWEGSWLNQKAHP